MNEKRANLLFCIISVVNFIVFLLLILFRNYYTLEIIPNFLVNQIMLMGPTILLLWFTKSSFKETFPMKKIKWSTTGLIVLFMFATIPLVTVINALTMLFTENAVELMSDQITGLPFIVTFFFVAIFGPVCEELTFRGAIYSGYRKSGSVFWSVVFSAALFGLIHMNFNQTLYAFVIGIALALLREATGSMLAPILYHILFNGNSVVMLYINTKLTANMGDNVVAATQEVSLIPIIIIYSVISIFTTALAIYILKLIAKRENREWVLVHMFHEEKLNVKKMFSYPLLIGFFICFGFMLLYL